MHYKDGTEAKLGDVFKVSVTAADGVKTTTVGLVIAKNGNGNTCNLGYAPLARISESENGERAVEPPAVYQGSPWWATAGECERVA